MTWAVVRVRGGIHARTPVVETLRHLRLTRPNHAVVVRDDPVVAGMVYAVQGYVTWGPVSPETVELLVRARGRTEDGKPVPEESSGEMAREVHARGIGSVEGLKPLFRLKAPTGGWGSTKKPYTHGGALGFRAAGSKLDMDALLRRMI